MGGMATIFWAVRDVVLVTDEFVDKPGVEEVHDCVLHPTDVDVNWHPFLDLFIVDWALRILMI